MTKILKRLPSAARIGDETVVGVYPLAEEESAAAMDLPTVERLLRGTRLTVPKPEGDRTIRKDAGRIPSQLASLLGGWFAQPLAPFLELHDSLVSQRQRDELAAGGASIAWDRPQHAFYDLSFLNGEWQAQACGDLDALHCIFLGHLVDEPHAIADGGHPRAQPLGPSAALLAEAVPALDLRSYRSQLGSHAPNVFDCYLVHGNSKIKAGLRHSEQHGYFYGIRIDIVLRSR